MTPFNSQIAVEDLLGPLNDAEKKHAPSTLFISGDSSILQSPRVSIIGSREATPEGLARARKLARKLVEKKIVIVSGLALGIDAAAHQAAIDAGGKTVGVIGTPLDEFYPKENRELQLKIAEKHLLISQFRPGTPTRKGNFPVRNRLMALISDATVIVEAKDGSGTTHQGWEALRLARPLWIPISAAENPKLKWPQEFLKYGAQVLTEETLSVLEESLPTHLAIPHDEELSF